MYKYDTIQPPPFPTLFFSGRDRSFTEVLLDLKRMKNLV